MSVGSCTNVTLGIIPGAQVNATVSVQCFGQSAALQVFSHGVWGKCDVTKLYHSFIWPSGHTCLARNPVQIPFSELSLLDNPCADGKPAAKGAKIAKVQWISMQNLNIEGWSINLDFGGEGRVSANDSIYALRFGPQVAALDAKGALVRDSTDSMVLTLLADGTNPSVWGLKAKLLGTTTAKVPNYEGG